MSKHLNIEQCKYEWYAMRCFVKHIPRMDSSVKCYFGQQETDKVYTCLIIVNTGFRLAAMNM